MGNIRPTYIKRVADELLAKYPTSFTSDFQLNKMKVGELTDVQAKGMRNRIAGLVTRRVRRRDSTPL
ncbi:MAG: 30S ribosomal protein S17e [Euryarchaeota archaeon]|jgi:small subunit ribosomal protein S17e|nr:30S ribosomal protein S17e [Euryarchaeota archaeon]